MTMYYCKFRTGGSANYERLFSEMWQIEEALQGKFIKFNKDSNYVFTDHVYILTDEIKIVEVTKRTKSGSAANE